MDTQPTAPEDVWNWDNVDADESSTPIPAAAPAASSDAGPAQTGTPLEATSQPPAPAALAPAPAPETAAPATSAPATDAPPPAAPTPPIATTEGTQDPAPAPFSFKLHGREVPVDGAVVRGDRIEIPTAQWGRLQKYLHDPAETNRVIAAERSRAEQAEQGKSAREAQAEALVTQVTAMLGQADDAAAIEQFFKLRQSWPQMLANAEAAHWRTVATQGDQRQQQVQYEQATARWQSEVLPQWVDGYVAEVLAASDYKDLAADTAFQAELRQTLLEDHDRFLKPTGTMGPDGWPEVQADPQAFLRVVQRTAQGHRRLVQQVAQIRAAAQSNAKPTTPTPPPAVAATQPTRAAAPQPRDDAGRFARQGRQKEPAGQARSWRDDFEEADLTQ